MAELPDCDPAGATMWESVLVGKSGSMGEVGASVGTGLLAPEHDARDNGLGDERLRWCSQRTRTAFVICGFHLSVGLTPWRQPGDR